jgi:hypothetical protein
MEMGLTANNLSFILQWPDPRTNILDPEQRVVIFGTSRSVTVLFGKRGNMFLDMFWVSEHLKMYTLNGKVFYT